VALGRALPGRLLSGPHAGRAAAGAGGRGGYEASISEGSEWGGAPPSGRPAAGDALRRRLRDSHGAPLGAEAGDDGGGEGGWERVEAASVLSGSGEGQGTGAGGSSIGGAEALLSKRRGFHLFS
jgi:hypothetical protein